MIPSPSAGMRSISKNGSRRRRSTGTLRSEDHKHNSDMGRPVSQQVGGHTDTDNSRTRNLSQAVQLHDLIRFVPSDAEATPQTGTVSPEKITLERDADHSQPTALNTIQRVQIEPERAGWARLSDQIGKYDQERIQTAKEDIDTLLVFAGLFSAVITAFIIESYKTLQQQPEDITNQILIQLSTQLASLQVAGVFVNSTAPAFTFPSFKPPKSSVLVNTLWSLSVVIALITASLGILIKQWFHEFLACDTQDPRERVKLRFFRDVGMKKWQVFELAAVLPLLLQLAVALFFVGLSILLYEMNPVVGWVTTSVMMAWLTVFIFATIAPAFSAQCPYKTPMLKTLFSRVRLGLPTLIFFLADKLTEFAFSHINQRYVTTATNFVYRLYRWVGDWHRSLKAFEEKEVYKDESLDMPSLICSQDTLWGEQLNDTIIHCFQRCNVGGMFNCFQDFGKGKDAVARGLLPDVPQGMKKEVCQLYSELLTERKDLDELFRTVHFPLYFHRLQTTLTFALTESYVPIQKNPITRRPFEMLSKLIEEGSRRAAFAVLTLYCVRFNTMKNYPEHWDKLFHRPPKLPDSMSNFCANTIVATRALIHVLWDQSQSNRMGDVIDIDLVNCLSSARWHSADSIPIDALVLAYTFGSLCYILPPVIVQATAPDVIGIMSQLADLMSDIDDVTPTYSRKECIGWTIRYFTFLGMVDDKLIPKLRALEIQSCSN